MNYEQWTMNQQTNEQITHLLIYASTHLRIHEIALYNCREASTNRPFLCKTNPISEKPKWM